MNIQKEEECLQKIPGKVIFKALTGSRAYGSHVEGSDYDYKGVYIQDKEDVLGFNYKPQIEIGKDEVYYEIRRFIELLKTANPTVLEMLYTPNDCIVESKSEFYHLITNAHRFLTKQCRNSFGGYAVQQIQKARGLNKKMNWEKESMVRKTPIDYCFIYRGQSIAEPLLDFLKGKKMDQTLCGLTKVEHFRDCYTLWYDWDFHNGDSEPIGLKGIELEDSNSIRISAIPKCFDSLGIVYYNKDSYTQHCKAFKEYSQWLKERNVQRYVDIEGHGQQIDGKNMLHCRRLLDMAMEIATQGIIKVRRSNFKELIDIRKGKVDLETILVKAEEDIKKLDELYANSTLPDKVSDEFCQELLIKIRS